MQDPGTNQPVDPTQIPQQWSGAPVPPPTGGPTYPGGPTYSGGYSPRAQISFDVIGEAWGILQQQMGVWIPAMLIVAVVAGGISGIGAVLGGAGAHAPLPPTPGSPFPTQPSAGLPAIQLVFSLVQWIVTTMMMGGMYRMAIKQFRGETPSLGDLFSTTDVIGSLLVAAILTGIATCLGACACGVGALVVGALLMFTVPLIVDKGMGPTEAMGLSWSTLKGEALMATVFYFVVALVAASGIILCGIGVLITGPLAFLSQALLYRNYFLGQTSAVSTGPAGSYPPPPIPDSRF